MKLLQLNAWGGRLEDQILDLIKDQNPDIVCLQEMIDLKGGKGSLFVTVEEIQATLGAEYVYMSPVYSFNYMNRTANFGNAIISKYPITTQYTVFTGNEYIADFDALEHDYNVRNMQHAVVTLNDGTEVSVLNHHGHHIHGHKNGDAETMRQCGLIAEYVRGLSGTVILAGDFNLVPRSESLEQINDVLTNLSLDAGLTTTRNHLTSKNEVCDYIFVSNDVKVTHFARLDQIASDHQALVADIEL